MALKGGSADKSGNVYESYWAVEDICHILLDKEDSSSIYFEKPDEIKDGYEYIVNKGKKNYCIQVKNYDIEWTISNLYNKEVLSNFIKRMDEDKNAICVFLSSSNTELDEIVARAIKAENKSTFFNSMITSKKTKDIISKLREKITSIKFADKDITSEDFQYNLDNYIFDFLRRIETRIKDNNTLKKDTINLINCIFKSPTSDDIFSSLFRFSQERYNEKFTKLDLIRYLQEDKGFVFNYYNLNSQLLTKLEDYNNNFINSTSSFYRKYKIERTEIFDIFNKINSSDNKKYFFVLGSAGCGKSIILKEVDNLLKDNGYTIIPIDIRIFDNFNNYEELGQCIYNKRISPVDLLANIAQDKPALIILDQLDSLSSVSGRSINKWFVINQLLQQVCKYQNIKVLIACRDFDLNKDSRLKEFIQTNEEFIEKIFINNLSNEVVIDTLTKLGVNKNRINEKLLKLFSIPLHLQMLCAVSENTDITNLNYENKLELYNAFWDSKCTLIGDEAWFSLINLMVNYLNSNKSLVAPQCIFDRYKTNLNKLLSEYVFCQDGQNISFFHETFYDYCFARILAANTEKTLYDFILASDQSLFIRSNVRQALEYLRVADTRRYLLDLKNILNSENIRVHVRTLILDVLLNFEKLTNDEINILINVQGIIKNTILNKYEYKEAEFLIQYNTGKLLENLIDIENEKFNQSAELLTMFADKYTKEIDLIINQLNDTHLTKIMLIGYPNTLSRFLFSPYLYKTARLYNILKSLLQNDSVSIKSLFGHLQYVMKDFIQTEQVFELYGILLNKIIQEILSGNNRNDNSLYIHNIQEYITKSPEKFIEINFKYLLNGIKNFQAHTYNGLKYDKLSYHRIYGYEDNICKVFSIALNTLAKQEPASYWDFIEKYKYSEYETILFLILKSLYYLPIECSDQIVEYIINNPYIYNVGYSSNYNYLIMLLLNKFTQNCDEELFEKLIKTILNYQDDYEYEYFKDLKKNRRLNYSPLHHVQAKLLDSMDKERLLKYPKAKLKLLELQRKFKTTNFLQEPKEIEGGFVVSPISKEKALKMSINQWKRAIYKYITPDSNRFSPCSGGAYQLSQVLEDIVNQNPLKFLNFICELDINKTSPYYINAILTGLSNLVGYYEEKETLIKYCLKISDKDFNHSIIKLLTSFINNTGVHLSDYCIDLIIQFIINPQYNDEWDNNDIDMVSINCTNGQALWLLQKILSKNINLKDKFNSIFDSIHTLSLATKVAFINPLREIYNNDPNYALSLLQKLIISDRTLIQSGYVQEFISQTSFIDNFEFYFELLKNIESNTPSVKKLISGMFTHYSLYFDKAKDIVLKYITSNDKDYKIGVAEVLSQYANEKEIRLTKFYQEIFTKLLNDNDSEIKRTCLKFIHQYNKPEELFLNPLFELIVNSNAFLSYTHFIYELNESLINVKYLNKYKLIINRFIELKEEEIFKNPDANFEIGSLFETILKVYELQEDSEILDLIDRFLLLPIYTYRNKINEFERTL